MHESEVLGVPVKVDPTLAVPPRDPAHLSFRENYSTVKNYLRPALNAGRSVHPVSAAFFNGVLRMSGLKWWQTIFVLLVVQAKPGGEHNEAFIREWAREIREKFNNQVTIAS
jgi:menaquinone-dependent protoporphyrinogen IX oxidase